MRTTKGCAVVVLLAFLAASLGQPATASAKCRWQDLGNARVCFYKCKRSKIRVFIADAAPNSAITISLNGCVDFKLTANEGGGATFDLRHKQLVKVDTLTVTLLDSGPVPIERVLEHECGGR